MNKLKIFKSMKLWKLFGTITRKVTIFSLRYFQNIQNMMQPKCICWRRQAEKERVTSAHVLYHTRGNIHRLNIIEGRMKDYHPPLVFLVNLPSLILEN